jgi:hypothetical protein
MEPMNSHQEIDATAYQQGEAQTLRGVIEAFERLGFTGQFGARPGGVVRCFSCRYDFGPSDVSVESLRRLEGASDPDDMLAVIPLTCPSCQRGGTLVVGYGPESSADDSDILAALPQPEQPPGAVDHTS